MLGAGLLGAVPLVSGSASAASSPVDIAVAADEAAGTVGGTVQVRLYVYDQGPVSPAARLLVYDYQAPTGTELVGIRATAGATAYFPVGCTWLVAGTHVQCTAPNIANFRATGDNDFGQYLVLKMTAPVTAPGSYAAWCYRNQCADPNGGNNTTKIVVHSDGAAKRTSGSRPGAGAASTESTGAKPLSPSTSAAPTAPAVGSTPDPSPSSTPAPSSSWGTPVALPPDGPDNRVVWLVVLSVVVAMMLVAMSGWSVGRSRRRAVVGPPPSGRGPSGRGPSGGGSSGRDPR